MNITIKTIPHDQQRYETAGDWWFDDAGDLEIRVSEMGDWREEALVAFHELAEVLLCKQRGITAEQVDAFDKAYAGDGEPGDDPAAPYRKEHFFATSIERLLAAELGIAWAEYDAAVEAL
jgi:hypothetical protein